MEIFYSTTSYGVPLAKMFVSNVSDFIQNQIKVEDYRVPQNAYMMTNDIQGEQLIYTK